jgi:hypothetical protein
MRKTLAFIIVLISAFSTYAEGLSLKMRILANLEAVENRYLGQLPFEERREAKRLMDEAIDLLWNADIRGSGDGLGDPALVDEADFERILGELKELVFDRKISERASLAFGRSFLTCGQLARILGIMSFEDSKLELIRDLAPRILDPHNIGLILDEVNSLIRKEEAEAIFLELLRESP